GAGVEGERVTKMVNTFCLFCACIDQASIGIVERWGRFEKLAAPGLNFLNPFLGQWIAGVLSTRLSSLDVRVETKTKVTLPSFFFLKTIITILALFTHLLKRALDGSENRVAFDALVATGEHHFNLSSPLPQDNVFVQILCSIQYRIVKENADDAFYELQSPSDQIQAYVFDVVRAHVPKMTLDELFEQKNEVAKAVLEELEKGEHSHTFHHRNLIPAKRNAVLESRIAVLRSGVLLSKVRSPDAWIRNADQARQERCL
ncbi:hypothetical protein ACLOJK_033470, partial [Asimina triloba]